MVMVFTDWDLQMPFYKIENLNDGYYILASIMKSGGKKEKQTNLYHKK